MRQSETITGEPLIKMGHSETGLFFWTALFPYNNIQNV